LGKWDHMQLMGTSWPCRSSPKCQRTTMSSTWELAQVTACWRCCEAFRRPWVSQSPGVSELEEQETFRS
jgi:hypothetical protein